MYSASVLWLLATGMVRYARYRLTFEGKCHCFACEGQCYRLAY